MSELRGPSGLVRYLYSNKNIAGCVGALGGLGLFFTGIVGPLWPVVVVGLYAVGALVAPGPKVYDLSTGQVDTDAVRHALNAQAHAIQGKVSPEVQAKFNGIQSTILGVLPKLGSLGPASQDIFVVQKTATDYLPAALQSYLNLPRAYASVRRVAGDKTPEQILLDQLTLIDSKMNEVVDAVSRDDTDQLIANGRFLAERFGKSELTLAEPKSS
jgi:hypothetical protein